jgi:hypothetical protein
MIKLVLLGDGKRWGDPFMSIPMTHSIISSLLFSYVTIYQFLTKIFFFYSSRGKGIRVLGWWAQESQTLREA